MNQALHLPLFHYGGIIDPGGSAEGAAQAIASPALMAIPPGGAGAPGATTAATAEF